VIKRLALFGATGDFAGRFLLPGLAQLEVARELPADLRILGAAREECDDDAFRRHVARELEEHAGDVPTAARDALCRRLRYRSVDVADSRSVGEVIAAARGESPTAAPDAEPVAVYLALPAGVFAPAVTALGVIGLPDGSRIALETPFGENLQTAIALSALLARVAGVAAEPAVFRVDHALGMATVQNILGIRLANRIWEPLWNSLHIEQVDLLWEADLTLEGRAGYYDRTGAQGRDPEPPAADPVPGGHGTAEQHRGARAARPQVGRAPGRAAPGPRRRRIPDAAGSLHRWAERRPCRPRLRRRARDRPRGRDGNLRRGRVRARHLAVGGHPLPAAHGQGARPASQGACRTPPQGAARAPG
jgi:Glucose-6-phosphate dehydrogenase, NAD binding domain/Glucose-6-phosphate dehydrogenase, C-terminal domain